mgnify:CR=1 FL=1
MSLTSESRSLGGITTYYVSIGPGNNKNYLKEDFQTQDSIEKAQNYIDNLVNQVVEQTKNDATDIKIKRIHNWLISTIQYEKVKIVKTNIIYMVHYMIKKQFVKGMQEALSI